MSAFALQLRSTLEQTRLWALCIGFFLLGIIPYLGALTAGFVFDDPDAILNNPVVNGDVDLSLHSLFTRDFWGLEAGDTVGSYRPLAVFSFALEYQLGGGQAWISHLSSLVFHGMTCAALFAFLATRFDRVTAAIAAGFFAVHALHTENIVALVARADVLATLLVILTIWFARESFKHSWLAGVSLFFALLAKETAVAVLAIVLADVVLNLSDVPQKRRRLIALVAMVAAFAGYMVLRYMAMEMISVPAHLPGNPLVEESFSSRLYTAAALLSRSFGLLLLPIHLVADTSFPAILPQTSVANPMVLLGIALWFALPASILFFRKRDPAIAWGAAIALASYVPIANIIVLVPTIFAERLLYLPSLGFAIIWARCILKLYAVISQRLALKQVLSALLVVYGLFHVARSVVRTADWQSNRTIFSASITSPPAGLLTHIQLGNLERNEGNLEASAAYFNHAIEVAPRYGAPYAGLGLTLDLLGNPRQAHDFLRKALQITPNCLACHTSIIQFYLKYGRFDAAQKQLDRLRTVPGGQPKGKPLQQQLDELKHAHLRPPP